jgi:hypothetical protein
VATSDYKLVVKAACHQMSQNISSKSSSRKKYYDLRKVIKRFKNQLIIYMLFVIVI